MKSSARFEKNIGRIASGSIISQAILIGATPLLARQYAPEAFGALAIFAAATALLGGIFTFKYDIAIILPRSDRRATALIHLTLSLTLFFTLILLAILSLSWIAFSKPSAHFFLLPFAIFLSAAYSCAQQLGARVGEYNFFAKSQVINSVVTVFIGLAIGALYASYSGGMVVAYVSGLAASCGYLTHQRLKFFDGRRSIFFRSIGFARLTAVMCQYRRFPIYVMPSAFVGLVGSSAIPFVLRAFFSLKDVGYFAMASRFLVSPSALIGAAISEAFRSELVLRQKQGLPLTPFFNQTLLKLVKIGVPTYGVIAVAAPATFVILLGEEYRQSGLFAQALCTGILFQFVAQPFGSVFIAANRPRVGFYVQALATTVILAALGIGAAYGTIFQGLLALAVANACVSIFTIALAYDVCRNVDNSRTAMKA